MASIMSACVRRGVLLRLARNATADVHAHANGSCRLVSRSVHSTQCKKMSEHGGHAEPKYLHAEHMYNLDKMKHQKLKMTLAVWTCFGIGTFVPIYAVMFQQKKTASA